MREQFAADEIEADGVYLVERPKAAPRVPPARRLRGEAIDVLPVYRSAEFTHAVGPCISGAFHASGTCAIGWRRVSRSGMRRPRRPENMVPGTG